MAPTPTLSSVVLMEECIDCAEKGGVWWEVEERGIRRESYSACSGFHINDAEERMYCCGALKSDNRNAICAQKILGTTRVRAARTSNTRAKVITSLNTTLVQQ